MIQLLSKNERVEIAESLSLEAEALYQSGNIGGAMDTYIRALGQAPTCWQALIGLGMVHHSLGNSIRAEDLIGEAISFRPDRPEAHVNLAIAQLQNGKPADAAGAARRALELNPHARNAHRVLGLVARLDQDRQKAIMSFARELAIVPDEIEAWGDLATDLGAIEGRRAAAVARRAILIAPERKESHYAYGYALQMAGDSEAALAAFAKGLAIDPSLSGLFFAIGLVHAQADRTEPALVAYIRAAQLDPNSRQATFNCGKLLLDKSRADEAVDFLADALGHDQSFADGHNLLAAALRETGRHSESIDHLRIALRLKPGMTSAYANLSLAHSALGQRTEAIAAMRAAVSCEPNAPRFRGDLAAMVHEDGQLQESFWLHLTAIALEPASGGGLGNFGNLLRDMNFEDRAHTVLIRASHVAPGLVANWNNLALIQVLKRNSPAAFLSFARAIAVMPESEAAYNGAAGLLKDLSEVKPAFKMYQRMVTLNPANFRLRSNLLFHFNYDSSTPPDVIFDTHREFGRDLQRAQTPQRVATIEPLGARKIRIGYVSGDFRQHVVSFFTMPLFAAHDREKFEIFCYDNTLIIDAVGVKFRDFGDHWLSIVGWSDEDVARAIRHDRIDILVDLSGHTGGNRLTLFGRRAAPIQVTAIGYPNTTGLENVDYRLTDEWADPIGMTDRFHSEKLVRLTSGFNCYRPPEKCADVVPPPALNNGFITFGCFNNFTKISEATIDLWARILSAIPDARLLVKASVLNEDMAQQKIKSAFASRGIDSQRIDCRGWIQDGDPMAAYGDVDIALDPFPYNGTTTTCDALWMGVPVVAFAGTSHRARVGVSLLSRLGEPGWIGQTPDEYLAIACALARDPAQLAAKRQAQRQKMAQSPLTDEKAYANAVESAYQQMVEVALRNQDVESAAAAASSTKSAKALALEEKIRALPYWYHKIELTDGVVTPGWAPLSPDAYGIPDRLDGLRVLDIGAWDGFWSFEAMKRGAREVVAIDDFSDFLGGLNERDRRAWENFDLCREALGYSPDQCKRIEMSIYDISPEKIGTFDVVFFFGTLYHLRHPLLALDQIASVATGELFVETAILDLASGYRGVGRGYANGDVVAEFYPGKEYGNNDTNWYTPTLRCLGAWMEAAGFEDIEGWLLNDRALSLATARGFAKGRRITP